MAKSAQLLGLIVITLLPNPIGRKPRGPPSAQLLLLVKVPNAMYGDAIPTLAACNLTIVRTANGNGC